MMALTSRFLLAYLIAWVFFPLGLGDKGGDVGKGIQMYGEVQVTDGGMLQPQ